MAAEGVEEARAAAVAAASGSILAKIIIIIGRQ
jgi:hypothetical protein